MKTLITHGRILDPASRRDEIADLLIEDGKISDIGPNLTAADAETIDATGQWVLPGLVDLHVHLRVPGGEAKEDLRTGTRAAAAGGVTSLVSMANTRPPLDDPARITDFLARAREEAAVNVFTVGAVTKGLAGKELTDIEGLVKAGAVALSDDGMPVMDADLMRRALEHARACNVPIFVHEEDANLARGGSMHEGEVARRLGHRGIPAEAEAVMVARDGLLAEMTGGHVHIQHISAAKSVRAFLEAKSHGAPITAEACPHHFTLTEHIVPLWGTRAKMNPPLRSKEDLNAVLDAVADGRIDVIATDHAPHTREEKARKFADAPFGIVGLETLVPLVITSLIQIRGCHPLDVFAHLTCRPAEIVHIPKGTLAPGVDADITIIDPEAEVVIEADRFETKGRNTPYDGSHLYGKVVKTIIGGKPFLP